MMTLASFVPMLLFLPLLQYNPVPGLNGFLPVGSLFGAMAIGLRLAVSHSGAPSASPLRVKRLDIFVVLFWLILIVPTITSLNTRVSIKVLFDWALAVLIYFYVARFSSKRELRVLIGSLVVLTGVSAAIVIMQKFLGVTWPVSGYLNDELSEERLNFGDVGAVRTVGIFLHANSQALLFSVLLPFCFGLLGCMRRGWGRVATFFVFVLGCVAQLLTLSRSGLLCSILSIGSIFFFQMRYGQSRMAIWRTMRSLITWLLVGAVCAVMLALSTSIIDSLEERFFSSHYAERDEGSAIARAANLDAGINATLANPGLGIGPGMSSKVYFEYGGWRGFGPHNMYLLLSSEFGIPVLVFFCLLLFRFFFSRAGRSKKQRKKPGVTLLGGADLVRRSWSI
ncbi:O-antigen ligase family protein [Cupriavidus basilensis]|uniref:O-antigen ligase family protein n=1 Tax=Cupriavidus basilensis TaxID=68895 RepID=UPI0009DB6C85|nr:O-antigen ligase family protein [Cupriavidus basilensis]